MVRPRTTMSYNPRLLTSTMVARKLGISRRKVRSWIARKILPDPTLVDEHGTRFFNHNWLRAAEALVRQLNGEIDPDELIRILRDTGIDHVWLGGNNVSKDETE